MSDALRHHDVPTWLAFVVAFSVVTYLLDGVEVRVEETDGARITRLLVRLISP